MLVGGQFLVEGLQQMTADANRQVELLDERVLERADTAATVEQRLPRALGIGGQGGRHRHPGHHHVRELPIHRHVTLTPTNCLAGSTRFVSVYSRMAGVDAGIRSSMKQHICSNGDIVTWQRHGSTAGGTTN